MNNYKDYIEQIKKKLDAMNKASGFDPDLQRRLKNEINETPSSDILDILGNNGKMWMNKNKGI